MNKTTIPVDLSMQDIQMFADALTYILDNDAPDRDDAVDAADLLYRLNQARVALEEASYMFVYKLRVYESTTCVISLSFYNLQAALDTIPELIDTYFSNVGPDDIYTYSELLNSWANSSHEYTGRKVTITESAPASACVNSIVLTCIYAQASTTEVTANHE